MNKSILQTIKKMLGIADDETAFDVDIINYINLVMLTLKQLGIGPDTGFIVSDKNDYWSDFIDDESILGSVQTYIYAKVKLIFDPPSSSTMAEALKSLISETEWRLNIEKDPWEDINEST